MAATGTSSANLQKVPRGLNKALVSAIFEWLLIFMLIIDAIFSYAITKFAYHCGLQTPCLLCSRLDHVLGKQKLGYYWNLFCGNHKSEISSLVLCHAHNKLVDVRGMCESCLFSFATINRSNAETYRLLVGKLGDDPTSDFDQDPLLGGHNLCFSSGTYCSCCNEPWISRGHSQKLKQTKKIRSEAELDVSLYGAIGHNQEEESKGQDKASVSVRATHLRDSGLHPLSHVGYTELKVTSDTESEVLFSDDDASALSHEKYDPKEDFSAQCVEHRNITPTVIDPAPDPKPSLSVLQAQIEAMESHAIDPASNVAIGHGLEELNWQQVESKADFPSLTKPILENASPSSNAMDVPEVSKGSREFHDTGTHEIDQKYVAESGEFHKGGVRPLATSEIGAEPNPISSNTDQQLFNVLDLGDAYKLVVASQGREMSGVLAEQWIGKDSSRVSEDLKLLLSQLSATRGIEQSTNVMSPQLSVNGADLKTSDYSNTIGMQLLQKRISLERNESGLSLDGSIVSEIEGESVVDRLKRQVEHDKKLINALYKELEEERNSSAVASDQAMAMITRLQEEKAALHMEALQNLRMMEEQAEYDNEALQNTDDLLAEKEKEIQDLEAELEFYRNKFPNESMLENLAESTWDMQARDIVVDLSESNVKNSLLDFEGEKRQILQCLEMLEKTLNLFFNNGVNSYLSKGDCSENGDGVGKSNLHNCERDTQENIETEEKDLSMQQEVPVSLGHISSLLNPLLNGKGQCEIFYGGQTDLASLGVLISDLNKRLKALEADREFLEHTLNSLRYGEEGLQFIREIASHLGELRKIGIRRDQTVA